jgi:hypothetical protein
MRQEHDMDALTDRHAGCGLVGEPWLVNGAECLQEGARLPKVALWQVHEDHLGHDYSSPSDLDWSAAQGHEAAQAGFAEPQATRGGKAEIYAE